MTQYTNKYHIARATLEAVCFQSKEILDAMNKDSGHPLTSLKVDGGLTNSDLCMQIQSDLTGISVERPIMRETTALGAALASAIGAGIIPDLNQFESKDGHDVFYPSITKEEALIRHKWWKKAIDRSLGWLNDN